MPLHSPAIRLCGRHASSALLALRKGGRLRPHVETRMNKTRTRAFAHNPQGEPIHRKSAFHTRFRSSRTEAATPTLYFTFQLGFTFAR